MVNPHSAGVLIERTDHDKADPALHVEGGDGFGITNAGRIASGVGAMFVAPRQMQ